MTHKSNDTLPCWASCPYFQHASRTFWNYILIYECIYHHIISYIFRYHIIIYIIYIYNVYHLYPFHSRQAPMTNSHRGLKNLRSLNTRATRSTRRTRSALKLPGCQHSVGSRAGHPAAFPTQISHTLWCTKYVQNKLWTIRYHKQWSIIIILKYSWNI